MLKRCKGSRQVLKVLGSVLGILEYEETMLEDVKDDRKKARNMRKEMNTRAK